jgi:exodeoxyribonuclease VII small subunit
MAGEAEKMSFEEALKELETIVEKLERGDVSLDDAVVAYERGTELKQHCQKRLDEAKMRVEAIRAKKASPIAEDTAPFDEDG